MTPQAIAQAAGTLVALRAHGSRTGPADELPAACRPGSVNDAYDVQDAVSAQLANGIGRGIVGWKIGCTTPVMQDYLGIAHPCAGRLYRATLFDEQVTLRASHHLQLGLECEIAVRLKRAPGNNANHTQLLHAIESVMTSVEIVEHRFVDFAAAGTPTLIADDFFSVGCVIGKPNAPDALPDLATLEGGFRVNGQAPETWGQGSSILGHPLNALAWLANHAHTRGQQLQPGAIVTLGSVVKTIYPQAGDEVCADFPSLGQVLVSIDA